jgi:hypothetical protein
VLAAVAACTGCAPGVTPPNPSPTSRPSQSTNNIFPRRPEIVKRVDDCEVRLQDDFDPSAKAPVDELRATRQSDGALHITGVLPYSGDVVDYDVQIRSGRTGESLAVQGREPYVPDYSTGNADGWTVEYRVPPGIVAEHAPFVLDVVVQGSATTQTLGSTTSTGYAFERAESITAFDATGRRRAVPQSVSNRLLNDGQVAFTVDRCEQQPNGSIIVGGRLRGPTAEASRIGRVYVNGEAVTDWPDEFPVGKDGRWTGVFDSERCSVGVQGVAGSDVDNASRRASVTLQNCTPNAPTDPPSPSGSSLLALP